MMLKLNICVAVSFIFCVLNQNETGATISFGSRGENADTISLFNGENLYGWYTFIQNRGRDADPQGVYTVQDGMIRISGEEWGSLTTNGEYENYHLVTEFKWGEITFKPRLNNARDCGLLLHSRGVDGG